MIENFSLPKSVDIILADDINTSRFPMRGTMLAAHWYYLLFSMSPCQRRPPEVFRSGSDPVKIVFDEFFIFHLILLFRFLVFVAPGSAWEWNY